MRNSRQGIVAVVVTRNRPDELRRCLAAIGAQDVAPSAILVIDNASDGTRTTEAIVAFGKARHHRLRRNVGGAGGYRAGIAEALACGARAIWLMDDDGWPAATDCLARLRTAIGEGVGIAAPLVLDRDSPDRLAFPIRIGRRTRFRRAELPGAEPIQGFADLFNGALIDAAVFAKIGLPDERFFIRGDEVEFLLRAVRGGVLVRTDPAALFLHPGSAAEIHPIMGGLFHAVEPTTPLKRYYQFRNRGLIFRSYGRWTFLLADVVRYGWFYLISRGDWRRYRRWLQATAIGWRGRFQAPPPSFAGADAT